MTNNRQYPDTYGELYLPPRRDRVATAGILIVWIAIVLMAVLGGCAPVIGGRAKPRDSVRLLGNRPVRICEPLFVMSDPSDGGLDHESYRAVHFWRDAITDVATIQPLTYGGPGVAGMSSHDILRGFVTVMWAPKDTLDYDSPQGQPLAGLTRTTVDGDCIISATIRIDGKYREYGNGDILQTVLRHELGHVLGLGHSTWSTDLMYPNLDSWAQWHPLGVSSWEVNTIRWLYEAGGAE